ncbi:MAG: head GIN domain-containing protein [Novosphingobium sp.]
MSFSLRFRPAGPLLAAALAVLVAGCDRDGRTLNGDAGKPLAELDLAGAPPTELVLLGPDEVRITPGETFAVTVEGAAGATEALRFTRKDGALRVLRKTGAAADTGKAVVHVTMPAPGRLVAAGSGTIRATAIAPNASITIAGSGDVETMQVRARKLEVSIAGAGTYRAAGTTDSLKLTIAGSGSAAMDQLKAQSAQIRIAGSGSSRFASDGKVMADILGSGDVRVAGNASCEIRSAGSGKLVCAPAASATP